MAEIPGPDFEPRPTPSLVDVELTEAETYANLGEKAYLVREIIQEVIDGPMNSKVNRKSHLVEVAPGYEGARLFILPGIPGSGVEGDDIASVRTWPANQRSDSYLVGSENHILGEVPQGYAWLATSDKPTYLRARVSECSVLSGKTPDGALAVAHLSYSEMQALDGAIALFGRVGIPPASITAVASTGLQSYDQHGPQQNADINARHRPAKMADYTSRGITPEHILSFNYGLESGLQAGEWTSYNLAEVLVSGEFVYTYNYDYDRNTNTCSKYRNERVIGW